MPGFRPAPFDKGPFDVLDRWFGVGDYLEMYDAVLGGLEAQEPLVSLAERAAARKSARGVLSADDVSHFGTHWLGGWWPELPVEEVLRAGFLLAIRTARDAQLPIETFWMQAGKTVQVHVAEGPHQVTVVVQTPPAPELADLGAGTAPGRIRTVRTRASDDPDTVSTVSASRHGDIVVEHAHRPSGR